MSTQKFRDWIANCQIVDTWRGVHGEEKDFTWSRPTPFTARRLDYIFCNTKLFPFVIDSKHTFVYGTDHKAVITTVRTEQFKRGPSYWKFNNSLLKDKEYVNSMEKCIDEYLERTLDETDKTIRWELLKVMIKSHTIDYCIRKCRALKLREILITEELLKLNDQVVKTPHDLTLLKQFEAKKKELEIYQLHKARGAQIRSRQKWIEEGEKNTKYFLRMEQMRGGSNVITSLQDDKNNNLYGHVDIVDSIKNHFERLYKKDHNIETNKVDDFMQGCSFPVLDDVDKEICDSELSIVELDAIVNKLNIDSAPGIDGITTPFYKFFWSKLRKPLFTNFQQCLETGELSPTQRRGVISLLHKGKNLRRDNIKNWRPITLTNTDYKIFSKILAIRLQRVMPILINENQTGFLKGRSISEHIRTLDDIIYVASEKNLPGMVVSLDFQRAFDTVEKGTILATLKKFNFGEGFINMVGVLMANTECCVQNGGWLSEWLNTERGIKQGCCTSPLLFVLVAELMSIKLRNNSSISGMSTILSGEIINFCKVLQYADDTTLILKDQEDLASALLDIDSFGSISGLRLNKDKSQVNEGKV
ncbi:uncharacterized protein LOC106013237 isoform X2 [Aplysia californica]|nr:uncharacterized protein LOC106013237 isoform X2 [Aplysia californica]